MTEGLVLVQSTLAMLLEVPEVVETLDQWLPGFKEALAARE